MCNCRCCKGHSTLSSISLSIMNPVCLIEINMVMGNNWPVENGVAGRKDDVKIMSKVVVSSCSAV